MSCCNPPAHEPRMPRDATGWLPEDAGQHMHTLCEVFSGLRYLVRYSVA